MMQKPDESSCVFGAGVLLKNLKAFHEEIEGVRQAEDIEYIHRMRVASRRLRSALPLFQNCFKKQYRQTWQKDIQAITRALGSARDTDVQIDLIRQFFSGLEEENHKPGIRRLLLRLRQKRQRLQIRVNKALDSLAKDHLVETMQKQLQPLVEKNEQVYLFSPALYQLSFDSVTAELDHFLSYESFIAKPECVDELHAMRIAAKQMRYTLEIFAPLYPGGLKLHLQIMRQIQDLLGNIHDCDIWGEFLPDFIAKETRQIQEFYGNTRTVSRLMPGLNVFLADRQTLRSQKYLEFNDSWKRWKNENIWPSLRQIIQTSFLEANLQEPEAPSITTSDANG